jgi:hypothetical protein
LRKESSIAEEIIDGVWIWQHDKRTDDYKIILNCGRKLMKNEKMKLEKAQNLKNPV